MPIKQVKMNSGSYFVEAHNISAESHTWHMATEDQRSSISCLAINYYTVKETWTTVLEEWTIKIKKTVEGKHSSTACLGRLSSSPHSDITHG